MKKLLFALAIVASVGYLVACGGGGGGGVVYTGYYDVFGNACGSLKPGCTYLNAFDASKANWVNDPGYDAFQDAIFANVFDTDLGYFVDAFGYLSSITGVFYDANTGRAINEKQNQMGRDVIAKLGLKEEQVIQNAGSSFAAKYNLDVATGIRVARALNDWNKIAKNRERTQADLADFTKRVVGVDLSRITSAVESGDNAAMDSVMSEAASNWNTSPQNMRKIVNNIISEMPQ